MDVRLNKDALSGKNRAGICSILLSKSFRLKGHLQLAQVMFHVYQVICYQVLQRYGLIVPYPAGLL